MLFVPEDFESMFGKNHGSLLKFYWPSTADGLLGDYY